MSFTNLGLRSELTEAVKAKGYTEPSPIQAQAIPAILAGKDVIGGAQTGTGKTAAFGLPLLQILAESEFKTKRPRCLILAPTRELAAQVHQSILDYGKRLNLKSVVIFGGVGFNPQTTALRRGVDIIVATPGRLLDLCQRREANLSAVEILVLDEADRMLDMGFIHDIKKILKLLPQKRQNLFFSATYSREVKKLADSILSEPVEVEVAPRNATADRVDQEAYEVGQKSKRSVLSSMISRGDWSQVLVFTRTKHGANRLATQLDKDGITSLAIHGNKSQSARERALASFKANKIRVLVATDIAARGLDIASLPYVVNFELPNVPEDYVHRIGRTGRAGKSGKAVSLVSEVEGQHLHAIEKLLKKQIPLFRLKENGDRIEVGSDQRRPFETQNRPHQRNSPKNVKRPNRRRGPKGRPSNSTAEASGRSSERKKTASSTASPTPSNRGGWRPRKAKPSSLKR